MSMAWIDNVDAALTQAKANNRPILIDFSAAPA
jgi:hypothetical protein